MKNLSTKLAGLALGIAALTASAQTAATFGSLPLYFEAGSAGQFLAHGRDAIFSVSPTGAQFALRENADAPARAAQMQFIGANPQAQICGDSGLPGKINYLTGNNPAQWRSNVPTFAKVRVGEIYPGINLVYYGSQQQLEYDFTIAAGANPGSIAIHFDGADKISVNAQGGLVLKLGDREILQPKPLVYQTVGGARKEISSGYEILNAHEVAFAVGNYDRALPLVIDPVLGYSTYFGGTMAETAWAVAVNTNDNSVYVAGQTLSEFAMKKGEMFSTTNMFEKDSPFSFPTNVVLQKAFGGGKITGDGFVAKFDSTGTNLIFLTYLGGTNDDLVSGIALDAAGKVFLTGFTDSSNFPVVNALYPVINGQFNKIARAYPADIFVAELDTNGSSLIYSTYFGGAWNDSANGIAVDSADNVYITGTTGSTNFPVVNAVQNHLAGTNNVFIAEIGAGGSPLVFSTYLGGSNYDAGEGIAVDAANNILVCGFTSSTNFPTFNTTNTLLNAGDLPKKKHDGFPNDAFVAKLAPSGAVLIYSTFLGSTNEDVAYRIACDAGGNAYVTGFSASPDFPNTETNVTGLYAHGSKKDTGSSDNDAFLTKLDPNGAIVYSTLFGGKGSDTGYGIGLDTNGDVFVAGATTSTDFPTNNTTDTSGAFRSKNSGGSDIFVTAFSTSPTNITALLYSGYLGGKKNDFGYNLAVDPAGDAYVVGQTASKDFPLTNAFQPFLNGKSDAFLTKIILTP
jgi:beta-propeller repeat-containing protein